MQHAVSSFVFFLLNSSSSKTIVFLFYLEKSPYKPKELYINEKYKKRSNLPILVLLIFFETLNQGLFKKKIMRHDIFFDVIFSSCC